MSDIILVAAAHPDDEILGCGGTAARLANEGAKVYTLLLGQSIAARHEGGDKTKYQEQIEQLKKCMNTANGAIGVQEVFSFDFPDNKFDTVALLDIVKTVENIKNKIKPNIIFTHYEKDLNIDHRITYEAVITATRPVASETVKKIYSFEVLSSTEWHYPVAFSPDTFFDISNTMEQKQKALSFYETELRPFPHPRSLEGAELNAKVWGMKTGVGCAEAFKTVRNLI